MKQSPPPAKTIPKPVIGLTQKRGAWLAKPTDRRSAAVLGFEQIPVMRDFDDGEWTWGGKTVTYRVDMETTTDGCWWLKPEHEGWRDLLREGAPLWVRKAKAASVAEPTGSVGRSIGVFATSSVEIDENGMSLSLTERLATVKS